MPDITVTAANLIPGTGPVYHDAIAGVTITAGQPCYLDTADDNKAKLADANGTSLTATVKGIATHGALAGQPVRLQQGGNIAFGAILTVGTVYIASATAGGIAPITDLASGWRLSILGYADTTSNLVMQLNNTGALKA